MKKNLTELVFILDRSGSMGGLESDTIGGFNSLLKKQQEVEGECLLTTVLFDNQYELLHDRIDIRGTAEITPDQYYTRGSTALLDAVGLTIKKISTAQKNTSEDFRPEKTLCVIITDGMENSSREYGGRQIKEMIELQKKDNNWEFVFLGANIDALETAENMGIHRDYSANYHANSKGVAMNFCAMEEGIKEMRTKGTFDAQCCKKINLNYENEKDKKPTHTDDIPDGNKK
ncbi:MAG: VWA domain-containing protein [Clostridiales bacterium]|nr:VWA domain-containing protein [Clostridiales bacterium]